MTDLIKPVPAKITQNFDGAYSAERPGWLRTSVTPHQGKRVPFTGGLFRRDLHLAIDYSSATGTPVKAMGAGPIVRQGIDAESGGAWFVQQRVHRGNFDYHVLYYHLKAESLRHKVGDVVPQGGVIALSGNTGWSSGPHLHVELVRLPKGAPATGWYTALHLDPQPYIDGTAHF